MPRRKNKPLNGDKSLNLKRIFDPATRTIFLRDSIDPLTNLESQVMKLVAGQTKKEYICPYCNQTIQKASSQIVVVPISAPDLRRHWHDACFKRTTRSKN